MPHLAPVLEFILTLEKQKKVYKGDIPPGFDEFKFIDAFREARDKNLIEETDKENCSYIGWKLSWVGRQYLKNVKKSAYFS